MPPRFSGGMQSRTRNCSCCGNDSITGRAKSLHPAIAQEARNGIREALHSLLRRKKIMKAETSITTEDSHELFGLSAVFIGLGILIHRLFFLVALIFALLAATKQLLAQIADSIFHRRC